MKSVQGLQLSEVADLRWNCPIEVIRGEIPDREFKAVLIAVDVICLVKNVQDSQLREVAQQGGNGPSQTIAVEIPDRESGELSNYENSQICHSNCNHKMFG